MLWLSYMQWSNYRKISKGAHTHRRKSVHNFGGQILGKLEGQILKRIGKTGSNEGVKLLLPKARSLSQLWGLGSVVSTPSRVWGGAPETEAIFNISFKNGVHFWILLISYLARGPNYVIGI